MARKLTEEEWRLAVKELRQRLERAIEEMPRGITNDVVKGIVDDIMASYGGRKG